MNPIKELLSDGEQLSTMRVVLFLIIGPIMLVWAWTSIKAGKMLPMDWSQIAALGAAMGGKALQSFAENQSSELHSMQKSTTTLALWPSPSLPTWPGQEVSSNSKLTTTSGLTTNNKPNSPANAGFALPSLLVVVALLSLAALLLCSGCSSRSAVYCQFPSPKVIVIVQTNSTFTPSFQPIYHSIDPFINPYNLATNYLIPTNFNVTNFK